MTECKGLMTYELEPKLAAQVLGETLKKLHSLSYDDSVLLKDVVYYKKEMRKIDDSKLSESDKCFIKNIMNLNVQDDLVFSHGDYCLPNILYDNGKTSLIDLDYAGVTFRYSDLLDCIWSLEYNFGSTDYTDVFLNAYGLKELDKDRVEEVKQIHRIMEIMGY